MKQEVGLAMEGDATVSLCSLRAGGALFGIDTRRIREVLGKTRPQRVPLAPEYIAGVVPYRGEVLTTVSFRALLGMPAWHETCCVLVLEDTGSEERLAVDGVGGVVTVDRSMLQGNPTTLDVRGRTLFDGAYRLGTGLIVRLDPLALRPGRLAESGLFAAGNGDGKTTGDGREER
jgi:purine-binding chemotaxis protein CheW